MRARLSGSVEGVVCKHDSYSDSVCAFRRARLRDDSIRNKQIRVLAAVPQYLLFAFVGYVDGFPDVRLEFAVQNIFVGNLRLSIPNSLSAHGLADHATKLSRLRNRRKKAGVLI